MRSAAIITAAGSGNRMGAGINKVLLPLIDKTGDTTCRGPGLSLKKNKTVIETAVQSFLNLSSFQKIIITHSRKDKKSLQLILKNIRTPMVFIEGGSSRQKSVLNALKELEKDNPETVLIHDAARPWCSEDLVRKILLMAENRGSAVPVIPSVNAMKKIDDSGMIIEHLLREKTVSAQTPQGFHYRKILDAHKMAEKEEYTAVDDTELWDRYYDRVSTLPGEIDNIKITYKKDLENL